MKESQIPRITGLLVIEVRKSNPNGDPAPAPRPAADVKEVRLSDKRKLRDLIEQSDEILWASLRSKISLPKGYEYRIMESRERGWKDLKEADETKRATEAWTKTSKLINSDFPGFQKIWDARRLETRSWKRRRGEGYSEHNSLRRGSLWSRCLRCADRDRVFDLDEETPAQEDKTRGMAPMAFRVVKHGVYAVPFVNPTQARKTGCTLADIQIMLHLLKHAYMRSVSSTEVEIIRAHVMHTKTRSVPFPTSRCWTPLHQAGPGSGQE